MTSPTPLLPLVRSDELPPHAVVEPAPLANSRPQYGLGRCASGYCDNPAIAYVVRRHHHEGRVIIIPGKRAQELGEGEPLNLMCIDCAHHEVDIALGLAEPFEPKEEGQ